VWENLYFHGRLFGIPAASPRRPPTELLEQFQLDALGQGVGLRPVGRHGPAADGGPGHLPPPGRALPRRAHRRARPQSRLALWETSRELNAEGQTILLTTHYMEEADQLCGRVAIMDHGKILALDTPAELKQQVGADTIVTVKATGDPERWPPRWHERCVDG
jgi:ABC-2 type transport system ATP-binding protein